MIFFLLENVQNALKEEKKYLSIKYIVNCKTWKKSKKWKNIKRKFYSNRIWSSLWIFSSFRVKSFFFVDVVVGTNFEFYFLLQRCSSLKNFSTLSFGLFPVNLIFRVEFYHHWDISLNLKKKNDLEIKFSPQTNFRSFFRGYLLNFCR